ncbi:MAG TPA: hypothetical protein VMW16_16375 [Sedimentisphaerales bacterium]|nr:hypothetical protein [Sedimentisphaerales bacterium]
MDTKHFSNLSVSRCLIIIIALALIVPAFAYDVLAEPGLDGEIQSLSSPDSEPVGDINPADINQITSALSPFCAAGALRYQLIEGSTLIDDCLLCGRPTIPVPIRGAFWLVPTDRDMWFCYFAVRGLRFTSISAEPKYVGRMDGEYQIGGDFALVHQMTLHGRINEFEGLRFDSGVAFPKAGFPWIEIDLAQVSPADPLHTFSMHLVAVPWPAIWFSTEEGFHPSDANRLKNLYVSDGDLLSASGRVIRTNNQLTRRLGIMPPAPDIGLDAVTRVRPAPASNLSCCCCRIWFSAEQDIFSETLGPLHHGDLLSDSGRIVRTCEDLVRPFRPQPPLADYGLDAVAIGRDGLLLFSTEQDFFSESLGVTIGRGDLLSQDGRIFKTNAQLMARFQPIEPIPKIFGLDAVYLWPHGEVWFSTEVDFVDARLGPVGHGDLLSDRGRIVARNRDLLRLFAPVEDLADFGLDGLHILRPCLRADFDRDGDVDLADFALFASAWSAGSADVLRDPDCDISDPVDNLVGIPGLTVFADNWLGCAE